MKATDVAEAAEIIKAVSIIMRKQKAVQTLRILARVSDANTFDDWLESGEAFSEMRKSYERHLHRQEMKLRRRAAQIGLSL